MPEAERLWATVGADITQYLGNLDQVEQRARSTAGMLESTLGNISVGTPGGWERMAGGLVVPAGALQEVEDNAAAATKKVGGLGVSLGGVARNLAMLGGVSFGIMGVRQAADLTVELVKLGAQAERLDTAFRTLSGAEADRMLEGLRKAARGTISDMGLMEAANTAIMLQVTDNTGEMVRLLEVAAARGKAMGLSTEQAFSDIVRGIGRISPLILDNLGILTGGQRGFDEYAKSIGKTSAALTDQEKRHYLLQKVINDTTTASLEAAQAEQDVATQLEVVAAAWANLRAEEGETMAQAGSGFLGWLGRTLDGLVEHARAQQQAGEATRAFGEEMAYFSQHGLLAGGVVRDLTKQQDDLLKAWARGDITIEQYIAGLDALRESSPGVVAAEEEMARAMAMSQITAENLRKELEQLRAVRGGGGAPAFTEEDIEAQRQYEFDTSDSVRQLEMLQEKQDDVREGTAAFLGYQKRMDAITEELDTATRSYNMSLMSEAEQLEVLYNELADLNPESVAYVRKLEEIGRVEGSLESERERRAGQAQSRWEQEQRRLEQKLRSTVEGVLQPTNVSDLDMARTRLGTYTDQWDEYVRRVRSAATDSDSAWKSLIPTDVLAQGADAVKVWAAETEEAFYAGQMPEMIDWDAFDRRLQQELARQESRERLIQEAMRRAGGAASKQDVAVALGLPLAPSEMLSMDLGQVAGQVQLGQPITDAFEQQLKGEQKHWQALGGMAVAWFAQGAEEGVSPATGKRIAAALFPAFRAMLDERYELKGQRE